MLGFCVRGGFCERVLRWGRRFGFNLGVSLFFANLYLWMAGALRLSASAG